MQNSVDPDQTPHHAASDLGLSCLPVTFLGVSRLNWIYINRTNIIFSPTNIPDFWP